ncbi:MAG: hypothetical protein AUJ47_06075 [Candidatus Marinimicrobia bacterium CG1_02_48_14]|nr:MAG: hypothetical protein AUJ47_06075 [Candidatus Marinimicrobia bacterium CG1_02_48_14]
MSRVKILVLGAVTIMVLSGCDLWNKYLGRDSLALGDYITIEYNGSDHVQWTFTAFPDSSQLTPIDILPSDTSRTISFKPDVAGKYDIQLTATVNGKAKTKNYFYKVALAETGELAMGDIPEHLKTYLETKDHLDTLDQANSGDPQDQNRRSYLDKIEKPTTASSSTEKVVTRATAVPAKTGPSGQKVVAKRPKATTKNRGNMVPRANKSFTIQISSWESLEEAQVAIKELRKTFGLEAYVQRVFFKDSDQVFYRVRVGNYKTYNQAQKAATDLKKSTNIPVWVDFVRQEM